MFTPREALPHGRVEKIAITKILADLAIAAAAPALPYSTHTRNSKHQAQEARS